MIKIIIPIEIPDRDFKNRLSVGIKTLKKNEIMLLGQKAILERMAFNIKTKIFYSRGMEDHDTYRLLFEKLHNSNTIIIVHDVESGSFFDNKIAFKYRRIDKNLFDYIDNFICWSDFEKNFLVETYPKYQEKFITLGNPKFAHPKGIETVFKVSENIHVLINMSMALTLSVSTHRDAVVENQLLNAGATALEIQQWKNSRALRRNENLKLLETVAFMKKKYPTVDFKIRPHPGDNYKTFIKEFKIDTKLITVSNLESLEKDMKNSDYILHIHCNTGIDALSYGKVSLCVDLMGVEKENLPSRFASQIITSKDELIKIIAERKTFNYLLEDKINLCTMFYKTLHNSEKENCQKIANFILSYENREKISSNFFIKVNLLIVYLRCLLAYIYSVGKNFISEKKINIHKFPDVKMIVNYINETEDINNFKFIILPGGIYVVKKIK